MTKWDTYLSKINELHDNKLYTIILEDFKNKFIADNLINLTKKIITINMDIDICKYHKYYKCLSYNINLDNITEILSICFDRLTLLKDKIKINNNSKNYIWIVLYK